MAKKALFYGIISMLIVGIILTVYLITKPTDAPLVTKTTSSNNLEYSNVNQFVYQQQTPVCLFFYSSTDTDSNFVVLKMLDMIKSENGIISFEKLYYVDLATLDSTDSENYTKYNWGFNSFPTFLVMEISNSSVSISNKLEWDSTNPYTIDDVRKWLKSEKIIN